MNIVVLNWRDIKHPLAGGAEQSLMEHAKYWQRKGASVLWISAKFPESRNQESIDGIAIVRRGTHYTVHLLAYRYFQRHLKKSTDIIIDCFHGIPYFSPFYWGRQKIIALINEPAKDVWFKNIIFPLSAIAYHLEPSFFRLYKRIPFVTSARSIETELKQFGIPQRNIHIIPHGVTVIKIKEQKKEKSPTIIYLSQLSPDKGIEDAIQAISLLKDNSIRLWVVGKPVSKEYLKKLQRLVSTLHIKKQIHFFGYVSQRKKFELLSKSWMLIHPSIREGWGLNVIEANSYGIPAIGYNVAGLRDSILDSKTGLLTKHNSPKELAKKVHFLIKNTHKREQLARNAKKHAKKFSWKAAGKESWQLIKKVYEK